MYCRKCGVYNDDGATVCRSCGQPMSSEQGGRKPVLSDLSSPGSGSPPVSPVSHLIRLVCLLPGALFACHAVLNAGSALFGIRSIFSGYLLYTILRMVSRILYAGSAAFLAAALLVMGIRYDSRKEYAERLLLTVGVAGILRIILDLFARILFVIACLFHPWISGSFGLRSFLLRVLQVMLILGILFILLTLDDMRPFQGLSAGGVMGLASELPEFILSELGDLTREAELRKSGGDRVNSGAEAARNPASGRSRMKEDRSVLLYYLVGICTCGIYQLYVIHTFAEDVNIMCRGDGEKDIPGIAKYVLLSLITCGIYSYVWHYRLISRMEKTAEKCGASIRTFGGMRFALFWVVCSALGLLLSVFGVGLVLQVYAEYLLFQNLNALSRAYNLL